MPVMYGFFFFLSHWYVGVASTHHVLKRFLIKYLNLSHFLLTRYNERKECAERSAGALYRRRRECQKMPHDVALGFTARPATSL